MIKTQRFIPGVPEVLKGKDFWDTLHLRLPEVVQRGMLAACNVCPSSRFGLYMSYEFDYGHSVALNCVSPTGGNCAESDTVTVLNTAMVTIGAVSKLSFGKLLNCC